MIAIYKTYKQSLDKKTPTHHPEAMSEIIHLQVNQLLHSESNPRTISKEKFEALCSSIKNDPKFFDARPCLVNRVGEKLTVYAGNQRLRAAKKLGWDTVPCVIHDNLPQEVIDRRSIVDNVSSGEWDYDILANQYDLSELVSWGLDPASFLGDIELDTEEKPKGKKAKCIKCPSCGHEFTNG